MTELVRLRRNSWQQFLHELDVGLKRQGSVVFALIFKEFRSKSERSSLASMIWTIGEPAVDTILLSAFWYLIRRQEISGINVALFLVVSFMPFTIIRHSTNSIPRALKSNTGYYAFQPVKPIDSVIARFILDWVLLIMGSLIVIFILYWAFGFSIRTDALAEAGMVLMITTVMAFGVSVLVATYAAIYPVVSTVLGFSSRGLIILSCVMHDGNDLPTSLRSVIAWNPFAQIEEYFRLYMLGVPLFPEASFRYMTFMALFFLAFGLIAYYANRFRLLQR